MAHHPGLHLAVALDGAGWHPAAWREPGARPSELFAARYWVDLVQEAERGLLDFVTIEDSLAIQTARRGVSDRKTDQVRGRLDAGLIAARVAPSTSSIGLVPLITTTHTEPFHVSKAVATLDYVSNGRAGVQARISSTSLEARLFGRRTVADPPALTRESAHIPDEITDLFDEATDFVEVLRRLWDSWEDDAEIRDVTTGRFIDREKLHYIDFDGRWFSVKGPSITPRSPQGQPLVAALAHVPAAFAFAARSADVVFTTPQSAHDAAAIVDTVREHERSLGRTQPPQRIFADLVVFLDRTTEAARRRKDRLDERLGHVYRSDASVFVGTPDELAAVIRDWQPAGIEGFRLRPGALPHDLTAITDGLVASLRQNGTFRQAYDSGSLRARLGLARPQNRYVAA